MNIPSMLRKARKAVAQSDFAEAERLYAAVLADESMQDMIDLQIRHAFCLEQMGKVLQAISIYQHIVDVYHQQDEVSAAKALQLKISILRKLLHQEEPQKVQPDYALAQLATASHDLDVMFEDDLTLDDIDLFGVKTQELTRHDSEEGELACVLVELEDDMALIDEAHISTVELIIQPTLDALREKEAKKTHQDDPALHKIKALIKQGVHQNITHKKDDDVEVVFTDIGDFTPVLDEYALEQEASSSEQALKHKAGTLFGEK